jgi:hypothetical protein
MRCIGATSFGPSVLPCAGAVASTNMHPTNQNSIAMTWVRVPLAATVTSVSLIQQGLGQDAEKNITIDTIKNQIKLFESNPEQLKTLDAYIQKYLAIEKHEKFKKETHRKIRIFKIKKDELLEEKS